MPMNGGMTEEEVLRLCSNDNVEQFKGVLFDWTAEYYGYGKILRQYGYYPRNWKLYIHTSHGGPCQTDDVVLMDIDFTAPIALFHNARYVNFFKKKSNKE